MKVSIPRGGRWLSVALSVLVVSGASFELAPASRAAAYTPYVGTDVVQVAQMALGDGACAKNPSGGVGFASSCTGNGGQPEYWCADFARWVWAALGVPYTGDLTAAAASFYTYGQRHGTLTSTPAVGDAVVFDYTTAGGYPYADHVAIVTEVNPNGTIESISGDWGGTGSTEAAFAGSSSVVSNTPPYPSAVGSYSNVMGMTVSGYIAPVGMTGPAPQEPDGTILRAIWGSASGLEAVVSGNRAFGFSSGAEFQSLGYASLPQVGVTSNFIQQMNTASNGHLIRNPATGAIEVSVGGAYAPFGSLQDLYQQYPRPSLIAVEPDQFPSTTSVPVDGTLMRNSAGTEAVVVGGRLFGFASGQQLNAAGYGSAPVVNVPAGYFSSPVFSSKFASGHLVRDAQTGAVAVTVGGAVAGFGSMSELLAQYPYQAATNLADDQFSSLATTPSNGTLMRNTGGAIAVAANRSVFAFPSLSDLLSAGYGNIPPVSVPQGYYTSSAFSSTPANGTLLRNPEGVVAVLAGGARFTFSTAKDLTSTGYDTTRSVEVSDAMLNALPTVAANRTLLRNPEGTVVVVAGGARIAFATGQDLTAAGYTASQSVLLSDSMLNAIPTVPANGTVVAAPGSSQTWAIQSGSKQTSTAPISTAVMVPASYLNSLPTS